MIVHSKYAHLLEKLLGAERVGAEWSRFEGSDIRLVYLIRVLRQIEFQASSFGS